MVVVSPYTKEVDWQVVNRARSQTSKEGQSLSDVISEYACFQEFCKTIQDEVQAKWPDSFAGRLTVLYPCYGLCSAKRKRKRNNVLVLCDDRCLSADEGILNHLYHYRTFQFYCIYIFQFIHRYGI